ncbi:MAG: hypothetical protein Q4G03_01755 [Planctomycetia bacterium]|nr:hypothetical protein [Planctomycetia bacterium]
MKNESTSSLQISRRTLLQTALASSCLLSGLDSPWAFAEDIKEGVTEPTSQEVARAIDIMARTTSDNVTSERLEACETIQRSVDRLRAKEFSTYFNSSAEEASRWENERGVLRYLNASFDKILEEIPKTEVAANTVVLWHVYNMGYVVKTPTQTFAVDIKHRRAKELLPYIEFLLVTHKHGDHYTDAFCQQVAAAGKPVVAPFIENEWTPTLEGRELKFGDCTVKTTQVDHNDQLINFVTTFEINCGEASGNCVIFHVGDACRVRQLNPAQQVDVFIPHLAVGLNVPEAVNDKLHPGVTLLSHILELGHLIDKWRWSYTYGYNICKKCNNDSVLLPVWGEKYVFTR